MGILASNFRTNFVKERMALENVPFWDYWMPMICFCDIPLHLISDHIKAYGQYGIGMSREWAIGSRLNPVFYYQAKSLLFCELNLMMTFQHEDNMDLLKQRIVLESTRNIYLKSRYIWQYYKPWFGYDFKLSKERYFYDEREWRYVPVAQVGFEAIYNDKDFEAIKGDCYKKLVDPYLLFEPKDINYIVLEKEAERYEIIQKIRSIKDKYCYRDVETLISKIITVEQIENDV